MTPHERIETGSTFFGKTFRPMRDISRNFVTFVRNKNPNHYVFYR